MSEVAEKAGEIAAEVVEESIDGVVDVMEVVRNNPVTLALVGVVGLAAGGAGGYFIAKKKLRSFYEDVAASEIAQAKEFYAGVYKTDTDGAVLSPQEVLATRHGQAAVEALRVYSGVEGPHQTEADLIAEAKDEQGHPSDEEMDERQIRKIEQARIESVSVDAEPGPHGGTIEVTEKVETRNVFESPTFDLEEESKHRSAEKPYIITHDEYFAGEKDYEQSALTYFEVDDTLVDERDQPIREIDKTIGEDHLVRFGTGSNDRNIVYIRNDRLELDYEVTKSSGSYLEEVLGMPADEPDSLKHSDQRDRRRAFRHGDG